MNRNIVRRSVKRACERCGEMMFIDLDEDHICIQCGKMAWREDDDHKRIIVKEREDRPQVTLVGEDGNAFYMIGACRRAAFEAGWTRDEVNALVEEMMAGDYDHLLGVITTRFNVG